MPDDNHPEGRARIDQKRTIELGEDDVEAAARVLVILSGSAVSGERVHGGRKGPPTRRMMVARAQTTFLNRRRRAQIFGSKLFGEPAWDMLLSLYITEANGPRHTLSRLVAYSGVAMTTALRWLDALEESNFIEKKEHPTDQRTSLILLSDFGREALDAYFSETIAEGL